MYKLAALATLAAAQKVDRADDLLYSGLPLTEPAAYYSVDGALEIEFVYGTCDYNGPLTSFVTRCYHVDGVPMLPGPTLYVYPGDTLTIKLTNSLSDDGKIYYHNFWQKGNSTNLHFHGGHVSAAVPGDSVIDLIDPVSTDGTEDSLTYVYEIPAHHSPGTAWYHPHGHGSATLQTGTGSSGMIIIQDPKGSLPSYIADAPEILLNINHFPLGEIGLHGTQSCLNQAIMMPTPSGTEGAWPQQSEQVGDSGIILVNGMTNPVVEIETGKWYRLRNLMASTLYMINGHPVDIPAFQSSGCQLKLMAKDSIYILDGLRDVNAFFFYPGMRADLMLMCPNPVTAQMGSAYFPGQEYLTHHLPNYVGNIFTLKAVGEPTDAPPLPTFETNRPCYLTDLRDWIDSDHMTSRAVVYDECEINEDEPNVEGVEGTYEWTYDKYPGYAPMAYVLNGYDEVENPKGFKPPSPGDGSCEFTADAVFGAKTGKYCVDGCSFELGTRNYVGGEYGTPGSLMFGNGIEGVDMSYAQAASAQINEYQGTACKMINEDAHLQVGDIMQWESFGGDFHPIHFHTHPVQIGKIHYSYGNQAGSMTNEANFTTMTGNMFHEGDWGDVIMAPAAHITLIQPLDYFAAPMIAHCHILLHEDLGMMQAFAIEGETGTHTDAKTLNPQCYNADKPRFGYEVTEECESDANCPTGWECPADTRRCQAIACNYATDCPDGLTCSNGARRALAEKERSNKVCKGAKKAAPCRALGCKWTKFKNGKKVAKCKAWGKSKSKKKDKKPPAGVCV